jgi:hypothetical protein
VDFPNFAGFRFYQSWLVFAGSSEANGAASIGYIRAVPSGARWFIGVTESFGGAGLILPGLTGILPQLTSLAGLGLILVMVARLFSIFRARNILLLYSI